MATLTSLPISLQSRILMYLCDEPPWDTQILRHAHLNGHKYYAPLRHPEKQISLEYEHTAHSPLPRELLSPALASPILATAAFRLLRGGMPFLTDRNTEGRLPEWVNAFSAYVQAVGVTDVGEVWANTCRSDVRSRMVEKICCDSVDLFREISTNHVRLRVLDLVHVPFDECDGMQDVMMTGLCGTLESCQSTLKELALPVYPKTEPCSRALQTVTLPYLTVLSIELKFTRKRKALSWETRRHLGRQFLRVMQAVDGHADRRRGLTTLAELRLINLQYPPCTRRRDSGCSAGFFHAIKTLRVSSNNSLVPIHSMETWFLYLFRQLECLHWTGMGGVSNDVFDVLCERLKEVHLCHNEWVMGAHVGAKTDRDFLFGYDFRFLETIFDSKGKIRTLVTYSEFDSHGFSQIARMCPNLRYLSLYVTPRNVHKLRRLIQKCKGLTGLEVVIDEEKLGRLGEKGWLEIGRAIPRNHSNLCELTIQSRWMPYRIAVPVAFAFNCLVDAVERMGARLEGISFRVTVRCESLGTVMRELHRILDTCLEYSHSLSYLEFEFFPSSRYRESEDTVEIGSAIAKLRSSAKTLILSRPHLTKLDLGCWHRFLRNLDEDLESGWETRIGKHEYDI